MIKEKPAGLRIIPEWLFIAASISAIGISLWMVFSYAPREAVMGEIQRIFYFHVASAWVGFFAFFVTFIYSVFFLIRPSLDKDVPAKASAEVGFLFISMTLATGMLWARPVWGVFWVWEPRLTISAVQWLIYFAYILLRRSSQSREREAALSSVFGIIGFLTVPLSWFAIRWWRTLHPEVLTGPSAGLPPKMVTTLIVSLAAFSLLYFSFTRQRITIENLKIEKLSAYRENEEMVN